jgi:tRNA pseudouridine38-40 synthase
MQHRVRAVIAYDGGYFQGFQKQTNTSKTITTQIEKALSSLGIHDAIRGSGRTDAGVHATGQVIDFLIPSFWNDLKKLKEALNRKLTYISFKHITFVDEDFHSRFWAKKRVYRYVFKTKKPSIFEQNHVAFYPSFNQNLLKQALNVFEGEHDFSNFIKTGSMTHTNIRHVYKAYYKSYKNYHIIYFEANGFLRSQVRMMIEGIMSVALNKLTITELKEQLKLKKRYISRPAPPEGLYLARILY